MVAPTVCTHMARNPLTTMEYLDCLAARANIDLLFDQGEWDGISGAVDLNVIVGRNTGALPPSLYLAGEDVGFGRQRLKVGPVRRGEQIGTAGTIATHQAHVQLIQKPPDRNVQLGQREEPMVAQPCRYPALCNLNGNFDLCARHLARTDGASMARSRGSWGRAGKIAVP